MKSVALTALMRIELPGGVTVRLCDGGVIRWDAETFKSKDATFGTVASLQALGEGAGDEVPALEMVLLPPQAAAVGDLSQPGFQTSRVRFWLGEYDPATGEVVGTPDVIFDGQIDQTTLSVGRDRRELAVSVVAVVERLFERNIGNSLSPVFHKSVWPGETGHDNATGLTVPVAWGAETPNNNAGGGPRAMWSAR